MVFESLVVDLINKYLGDYVENLDRSQLKLGIWGGDAVLQNLDLKESALDDLDLPVQIKAGHIGKLTLKIPWKNLYTEPVVASIDGIYALAVPKVAIQYNEEKEEKAKQDAKQKKLLQIEEAKKLQAEKDKPKEPKKDSFAEKMATQIIKNLQIHVKNIHVRYEDKYTNPKHPFSIGVSLEELLFQTTDEKWRPCILKESVTQIYKLIKLNALSLYWNSKSQLYSEMDKTKMLETLKSDVENTEKTQSFEYLIKPISSVAHLRLNTKPEQNNYSIPKIFLTTVFDEIGFALSKLQYDDVLSMLESFERMYLLNIYRKYRPSVPLHKNAKSWWHYAMNSILEETVRRRRQMFSWTHIIAYRRRMKKYREAYIKKIQSKKVSSELQKELDEHEKILDVFCITLMRQQAEVEAARLGAKKAEEKSGGWFGGWFGGKKKKEEKGNKDIQEKFQELYSDDEKSKLYDAIGYQENEADASLPKEFVAVRLVTKLNSVSVTLKDSSKKDPQILNLQLHDVYSSVGQRPAASAVQVEAKIDEFSINGTPQDGFVPKMVESQKQEANEVFSLADFNLETNPLDGNCDTRVRFNARPLQIVYDAITVNQLAEFFKPPEEVYLKQLSHAAMAKFEEIKEQSTTGLQHAIEQRKYTDIMVDLKPSYVIVPSDGLYKQGKGNMLLLDLGSLKINSEKNQSASIKRKFKSAVKELVMKKAKRKLVDAVDDILQRAYDNFNIKLDRIQMLFAKPGEDWQSARRTSMSPMHILNPISINVVLQKCMFENDARMPKMKVSGELPLLSLSMSDKKLEDILKLVTSIPLPETKPAEVENEDFLDVGDIPLDVNENQVVQAVKKVAEEEMENTDLMRSPSQEFVNYTDLQLKFEIKEVSLHLHEHKGQTEAPLMKVVIQSLGTEVAIRKYDMNVEAYLGGIYLQHLKFKAPPDLETQHVTVESGGPLINLINTPVVDDNLCRLLTVTYLKADPEGPEFVSKYANTEQKIDVTFTALEVLLHLEAIQSLMKFADDLQHALQPPDKPVLPSSDKTDKKDEKKEEKVEADNKPRKKKKDKEVDPNKIDIQVSAQVDQIAVAVCTEPKLITDMRIKGINAGVTIQEANTSVSAMLKAITIYDPDKDTLYPRIMEIEGEAVLKLALVIYNHATEGESYSDMSAVDTSVDVKLGCIRLVFLNKFVTDLLEFLDNFQTAKEKIKEASDVVAESAMDVVAKLQEKSPRVSIKVHMSAPVIVIPRKSTSRDVLLADLGELQIGNSFSMAGKKSSSGVPAVFDKMHISLTKLKVLRAERDPEGKIVGQSLILEPVNIDLEIVRNLSISWYQETPEVDISGKLLAVSAVLSQGDFTVLMYVLNENLTEGQSAPSSQATPIQGKDMQAQEVIPIKTTKAESPEITVTPPDKSESSTSYTKLKFQFEIGSLCAALHSGDSVLTEDGTNSRSPDTALGKFELKVIAVKGIMMSDSSMKVKVILQDTVLDDSRIAKQNGGITRMIERCSSSEDKKDMIDVNFEQDVNQDKSINVNVSSIHVCVCLDFLMSLADFFTKGMPQTTPQPTPEIMQDEHSKSAPKQTSPPPQGEINIVVTVDKPEIILIEDQMNPSCNALALETELLFRMRISPESQDMSANITDLQIVTCIFDERSKKGAQILNPCQISFYSKAPLGKGAHMDISTTDLILNISPGTIHTITLITAGLSQQKEEEDKKKQEQIPSDLWLVKKVSDMNFWFTKTVDQSENRDLAIPTVDDVDQDSDFREEQGPGETLILKVPIIVVKIEGGVGKRTVPLLIVEAGFQGEVRDWSGKLQVESSLKLEVAFYNEKLSVWEPLIEPVLQNNKIRRWELGLEVTMNDDLPPLEEEEEESDTKNINLPPPKMSINVKSQDALQMTITKTCIEVLTNLGKAFGDAYWLVKPTEKAGEIMAPYVLENHTGIGMIIKLDNTFEMPEDAKNGKVNMHSSRILPLFKRKHTIATRKASVIKAAQEGEEEKFIFQIEQYNATREITIKRAEERLYQINHKTYPGDVWAVVCTTETPIGQRIISLRSIVQMKNHLMDAVEVFYKNDKQMASCGIVQPGQSLNVPLHAVYTPGGEFLFNPVNTGYGTSTEPITWRAAENMGTKQISCEGPRGSCPYYIGVRAETKNIYFDESEMLSAKTYIIHLSPTVVLHNLLPLPVTVLLEGMGQQMSLNKGQNKPLVNACVGKTTIELAMPCYQNKEWTARCLLRTDLPDLSMVSFEAYEGAQQMSMNLGLHCKRKDGCLEVSLYSPYWMINKTGKTIFYKTSDSEEEIEHPQDCDSIILFSFRQKTFLGAKKKKRVHTLQNALAEPAYLAQSVMDAENLDEYRKCQNWKEGKDKNGKDARKHKVKEWKQNGKALLRIGQTDWSDKFSLDTVGSSGTVQCKSKSRIFEVGVKIRLSNSGLTKICTLTPFFMLLNTAEVSIICTETTQEDWVEVKPGKCLPFWPMQSGKEISMKAKFMESHSETMPFLINKSHSTLMKLNDEYGGVNVDCQVTESAMVTTFCQYKHGMASVLIVNHTEKATVSFIQCGEKTESKLLPNEVMLYTWENALGKREIAWTCGEVKGKKNDLQRDGQGGFFVDSDTKVYWVSFLDGMQRVLLFTDDPAIAINAQEAGELERLEQEINVCIQGMGLSLVNDDKQIEVAFLGITSSGIIWEEKKKRFKALSIKNGLLLEEAYQKFLLEVDKGHTPPAKLTLSNKMEVSFAEMKMFKPSKRMIRRSFQDGIWLQYKTSAHQLQLHAKINRLQLDNMTRGPVFPTVLAPIPPPKSVASESVPKPFTEVSIMLTKHEHSKMSQFKYFKVLIQEMSVKVDQGFLNNVIDLFTSNMETSREQETELLIDDVKKVQVQLMEEVGLSLAEEQKNFYDYLHFSPIKIHLSFSLQGGGGGDGKPTQIHANVINIFLQSVGVVLTDVQDVVFKLGFFQREHCFYNQTQIVGEMSGHYAGQAIKQAYVLVLGLDVLGNPFGLLRGMAEGVEDLFYEPYQGAIQGPEEFAEGLALGVRSLLGHAVGGAAGAVSRITGTIGKGIAALTLDDEYQKKRREAMNKRPANVREGLARGGKGLVMGVVDGVTGIVRKPIEGAQKEGVEGFFKGIGKGLVGVVTRPTSGVIDFASSSFEGIKRIADMSSEVGRLRSPRRFHPDRIIRPYNGQEADGYSILQETEKGKFMSSDDYVAHAVVSRDGKHVLLVTDKRVIFANRGEIFGHWDADWTYTWQELKDAPKISPRGIEFILKEKEKKKLFQIGSSLAKKEIPLNDKKLAEWIIQKMKEAYVNFK